MGKVHRWPLLGIALLMTCLPTAGHHTAEFDRNKEVVISGKISKLEWISPHVTWHLDVINTNREVEGWVFQGASPDELRSAQITEDQAGSPGDFIIVRALLPKDGTRYLGLALDVTFPDSRKIVTVPSISRD